MYGIETWHVRQVDGTLIRVQGQCFGPQKEALYPTELYSFQADSTACRLTEHGGQLSTSSLCTVQPIHTKASDGASLTGILLIPRNDSAWTGAEKPPAAVGMHGGPYVRINCTFNIPQYHWGPWLASLGYVIILPNYRGSSSQGEEFAIEVGGAVGKKDYEDTIIITKAVIHEGLVDPNRVAIGSWSQGGFLSYLSAVQEDQFQFRAAVCGAGVTDWDMLINSSDFLVLEQELAGGAPWIKSKNPTKGREGSALWHIKHLKTPVLLLHGEADQRVPVSQAIAFRRASEYYGNDFEMTTYPDAKHNIDERAYRSDMLFRIKAFLEKHMS